MEPNTSNGTNSVVGNSSSSNKDAKRQQFTSKQRLDMYAFCVLEQEMHSNKVSIKKKQQAIQKVFHEQREKESHKGQQQKSTPLDQNDQPPAQQSLSLLQPNTQIPQEQTISVILLPEQLQDSSHQQNGLGDHCVSNNNIVSNGDQVQQQQQEHNKSNLKAEEKTLSQLQQEFAMTRKCYSDYQKTQVLTASMLRGVQERFARYYPDAAVPSRTTIKHVFEKCVSHGTVENMKTPRKATKLSQGDEIEHLLLHEPQLSLRQLAQKLNVSTGTISRRCKALGLVPESVTIKHQQLATARRQRQIKKIKQTKQIKLDNCNSSKND